MCTVKFIKIILSLGLVLFQMVSLPVFADSSPKQKCRFIIEGKDVLQYLTIEDCKARNGELVDDDRDMRVKCRYKFENWYYVGNMTKPECKSLKGMIIQEE